MLNWEINQYSKLINKILDTGEKRASRAGEVYSLFGEQITIDLQESGFPLLHGRKMFYNGVLGEFAAFLRGPKNIEDFKKFGCNYWDAWKNTDLSGKIENQLPVSDINLDYGNAWIDFNGVNQLQNLVDTLIKNPLDRRMIISGWRPDRLAELSLPCCHLLYQWYVRKGEYLDMIWYQRSVDTMVGLPSDIVLAAIWNIILAYQCGYKPGKITLVLGDTHIYANHIQPTLDYLRQLKEANEDKIIKQINYGIQPNTTVFNFKPDMLDIHEYKSKPAIKFELNV